MGLVLVSAVKAVDDLVHVELVLSRRVSRGVSDLDNQVVLIHSLNDGNNLALNARGDLQRL